MKKHLLIAIIGTFGLVSIPGLAHHSSTMFDRDKEITVTGIVKEFQYTNPHSWLIIEVTNEDGSTTNWGFEAEGPSTLIRAGISKKDFAPGTKLTITGNPMRDGRSAAYWKKATREDDGKVFNPGEGFVAR